MRPCCHPPCGIFLLLRVIIYIKWRALFPHCPRDCRKYFGFCSSRPPIVSEWRGISWGPGAAGDNEQNSVFVTPLSWRGCKVTCPGCICVAIKILSIVMCGWPASAGEGGGMRWLGFSLCFPIVSELSVSVYRSIYDNTDNRVYQWHHLW